MSRPPYWLQSPARDEVVLHTDHARLARLPARVQRLLQLYHLGEWHDWSTGRHYVLLGASRVAEIEAAMRECEERSETR